MLALWTFLCKSLPSIVSVDDWPAAMQKRPVIRQRRQGHDRNHHYQIEATPLHDGTRLNNIAPHRNFSPVRHPLSYIHRYNALKVYLGVVTVIPARSGLACLLACMLSGVR
jgi:hypothetical protein